MRKQGSVTRGHIFDELGHLQREVELPGDLGVALLQFREMLLELVVTKQCVVVIRGIIDDAATELRGGGTDTQAQHEQANQNLSFHKTLSPFLHKSEGILWLW